MVGPCISHLLYADDILITSQTSTAHAKKIIEIHKDYCKWIGQRINASKSTVIFSKVATRWRTNCIARLTGFHKIEELEYLDIRLAMRRFTKTDHLKLLQRGRAKLIVWGSHHLSLVERATLLNTSLLPLTTFQLTHTKLPSSVLLKIKRIYRNFFYQGISTRRSIHYVSWATICQPQMEGGLDFHSPNTWKSP